MPDEHKCAKCEIYECDECIFYTMSGEPCDCSECGGADNLEG